MRKIMFGFALLILFTPISEVIGVRLKSNKIISEYQKHTENQLYSSVMNIIIAANKNQFQEVTDMCEALEELITEKCMEKCMKICKEQVALMQAAEIAERETTIAECETTIAEQEITIAECETTIAEQEITIAERDATIAELQTEVERLRKLTK